MEIVKGNQSPYEIYIREKAILNRQTHERAHTGSNPVSERPEAKRIAERRRLGADVEKARALDVYKLF